MSPLMLSLQMRLPEAARHLLDAGAQLEQTVNKVAHGSDGTSFGNEYHLKADALANGAPALQGLIREARAAREKAAAAAAKTEL